MSSGKKSKCSSHTGWSVCFLTFVLRYESLLGAARKHDDDFRRNAPWFGPAPPPSPLLTLATLRAPKPRKPLREAPG